MYRAVFGLLRRIDPEQAHHLGMVALKTSQLPPLSWLITHIVRTSQSFPVTTMGLDFANPLGIAAGFDKNAEVIRALGALGFGHIEVGTVTPRPQPGNPKPRLFRLAADFALVNRMGFNNVGAREVARHLLAIRAHHRLPVIGVNIGKNRDTPVDKAVEDYRESAALLAPVSDYLVINVSSPNTPGLRSLQDPRALDRIVSAVLAEAGSVPVLVKLSPDLADADLIDLAQMVGSSSLAGVVATNTTVRREGLRTSSTAVEKVGEGGLSGAPLAGRSEEVLQILRGHLDAGKTVISVGGVSRGTDVSKRLAAGANLVQLYTSFIYRGPLIARHLLREMSEGIRD